MPKIGGALRAREAGRSGIVMWLVRDFIVRAGELTGHGDDLFFLEIDAILAVLRSDDAPLTKVPAGGGLGCSRTGRVRAGVAGPRRPVDAFERALLGVETITWGRRRSLLAQSAALEGRHWRPGAGRDGGVLFGHELGHFWGDFLPVEEEIRAFRVLTAVDGDRTLVACLEVFEAAMEAEIIRSLRLAACGEEDAQCVRTLALIEAVETAGAGALESARLAVPDWYAHLECDPAGLVDTALLAVRGAAGAPVSVAGRSGVGVPRRARRRGALGPRRLHALGGVDAEQVEATGEGAGGQVTQGQPAGAGGFLGAQHRATLVEAGQSGRQAVQVARMRWRIVAISVA